MGMDTVANRRQIAQQTGGADLSAPQSDLYHALLERPTVPLVFLNGTASKNLFTGPGLLVGWTFRETNAAPATYRLIDSGSDTAAYLAAANMPANGIDHGFLAWAGPLFYTGMRVQVVAGQIEGVVWVRI